MARGNDGTGSNYLRVSSGLVTVAPLTMAGWIYPNNVTEDHMICVLENQGNNDAWWFLGALGATGGDPIGLSTANGGTEGIATTSTSFVANRWQHAAGVVNSSTSRESYLNGGGLGTNATSITPALINTTFIGNLDGNGGADYASLNGYVADVAIWKVALTQREIQFLASGGRPSQVRPRDLVAYWDLPGLLTASEPDRVNNRNPMTTTGTMLRRPQPPMLRPFRPRRRQWAGQLAAPAVRRWFLGAH